jgi:hypothetical protein
MRRGGGGGGRYRPDIVLCMEGKQQDSVLRSHLPYNVQCRTRNVPTHSRRRNFPPQHLPYNASELPHSHHIPTPFPHHSHTIATPYPSSELATPTNYNKSIFSKKESSTLFAILRRCGRRDTNCWRMDPITSLVLIWSSDGSHWAACQEHSSAVRALVQPHALKA